MKTRIVSIGIFMLASVFLPASLSAQTFTSVIEGTVSDPSKSAVPNTIIAVKGPTVERSVETDGEGYYRIVALPAGSYRVTFSHSGFKTKVVDGIVLVLNRTVELDLTMEIAPQAETVEVKVEVPILDTTDSSTKHVIESRTIDSIPLNGRNYLDLILLTPGAVVNTNARADLTGRDTSGAIMGERAGNTAYLIDGLENNDDFHGGVFQAFTQDVIQEFEVIDTGFKAEFGRGSAAVVNVVSKSGSNTVHGNAFLFARNEAMDTSNVSGQDAPNLSRYDYGGTFGLPVRKDKSWFFGSLERVQEGRSAIFPPDIPPSLAAGEDFSRQPTSSEIRAFGKYSQHITEHNDFRASLSWTRSLAENRLASPVALPSASNNSLTHTWLGTVSLTTLFNPHLILDSSFSVRSQDFGQNQGLALGTTYSIFFLDDGRSFDFGPPFGSVQSLEQRYYTGRGVVSYLPSEKHSAKFGVEFTRTTADGENGQGLQDVIVTIHPFFDLYGLDSFQIPQGVAFLSPGDNLTRLRNNGISLFAQDDWRIVRRLTLSGGLRYDYDSKFNAPHNFAPRLGLAWSVDQKTVLRASWGIFYDRYRLGIAQAVPQFGGFNGTTVVELDYPRLAADALIPFPGSLGVFAAAAGSPDFLNTQFDIPAGALVTESGVQALTGMSPSQFITAVNNYLTSFGIAFTPLDFSPSTGFLRQEITGGFADANLVARPFRTPYNMTFAVGVQRELVPNLAVGVSYVHRSIRDILGVRITNLSPASAAAGAPITTDGGPLQRTYGPWYDGKYDALILTLDKRFSRRFQIQANYTYARSTDDLLNSNLGLGIGTQGGGAVPSDNNNVEFDRGNSDLFVPHVFVASGTVELPWDFRFSGVVRAMSGLYFSAAGTPTDFDGDGIVSTRPVGTTRNEFRGPASFNLDTRIEKRFRLGERYTVSVLGEFFNMTNQANPSLINNFFAGGAPGPDFGKVLVPLPGREVQLGLRLNF